MLGMVWFEIGVVVFTGVVVILEGIIGIIGGEIIMPGATLAISTTVSSSILCLTRLVLALVGLSLDSSLLEEEEGLCSDSDEDSSLPDVPLDEPPLLEDASPSPYIEEEDGDASCELEEEELALVLR